MLQLHPMYTRQIESRNVSSETNRFKTIAYNSVYSPQGPPLGMRPSLPWAMEERETHPRGASLDPKTQEKMTKACIQEGGVVWKR